MTNNILFYDFEVFILNWMCVIIDYNSKEKTIIVDNPKKLKQFYNAHKDDIWIGYNSRNYDQFILKGILDNMNPYKINNAIILEGKKGYQVIRNFNSHPLNNFDISNAFRSLKELEGFMGSKIKESSVPFDIDRKLTKEEIDEVIEYCTHDVEQTIEVFNNTREEFDSQLSLIKAFDLPMTMFTKTKAQLAAYILGAEKTIDRNDEFELRFPDTLKISEKYQYVLDWYKDKRNHDYKKKLITKIANVNHVLAWGGIHGAITNYKNEGILLCLDISAMYPSLMIEYNFLSRNVKNPKKYKEIRDNRLKLKAEKNPMQAPLKIVINSTYGAMKDKYNNLYDPLMANNVCIAGQLLLLDLIEKLENHCLMFNVNTDGVFMQLSDISEIPKIKQIAAEWEARTRLNLEWEIYDKIYQKDVNNYIITNKEGKYKSKGSYIKKLNNVDYDLPIVNSALVNYFINKKPIEDTINECNTLREFQKIVKITRLYKYALHGEKQIKEKVLRVFASNKEDAPGIFKLKTADKIEKISNTPEKCFIYNDSVFGKEITSELDKQYYIDLAYKRLSDYLDVKNKKMAKLQSEIKFVNQETKDLILEFYNKEYSTFIDFLVEVNEQVSINKQMKIMIKLNYFTKFGGNKKLLEVYREFEEGKFKYVKTNTQKTKDRKIEALKEIEKEIPDEKFTIKEQMKLDVEFAGKPINTYPIEKTIGFVNDLNLDYSPKISIYGLSSGKFSELKINKKKYELKPISQNDIIQITKHKWKAAKKKVDKKWEDIQGKRDCWIEEYIIRKDFD